MKRTFQLCWFLVLLLFASCNDDAPCNTLSLDKVYPNSSPTGGPVLLQGKGFSSSTLVRFGNVAATVLEVNENYISTQVPPGLQGLVELSIANGDECVATENFEVVSSGSNLPASPTTYIIPNVGAAFPPDVGSVDSDDYITLTNLYDPNHEIFIQTVGYSNSDSYEQIMSPYLTNPVTVELDIIENWISIFIDRSDLRLEHNMPDDVLEGKFYNLTLLVNGQPVNGNFLIAFSTITGRQYVFKSQ